MSNELSGIITFLNKSFNKFKTINEITDINDAEYLDKVLRDIEQNFFCDMNYLPSDSQFNKQYNLRIIYTRISSFFEYVVKKPIEENYFDYKDDSSENFLKLSELIVGVCAQSKNREEYFEVLNDLSENESNEIFQILSNLIPLEDEKNNSSKSIEYKDEKLNEKVSELEKELEEKANENAMLWIRAENAEKENERMSEEINELQDKITDLTKDNYTMELNLKETESKYQELVSSLKKEEGENLKNKGSDVNLSIKISELKGKLEAKTKSFYEYQEEKEKLIDELNTKLNIMRKESLSLKEVKVKYDVLQNELNKFSLEDMSTIKERLLQCERTIKDKDEEINRLRSSDNQNTLLKNIEDLHKEKALMEEQLNELQDENETIKQQLLIKDCEITQLKESLGPGVELPESDPIMVKNEPKHENAPGISLGNLIEEENKDGVDKEKHAELERKIAELEKEKTKLTEQIQELNAKIEKDKKFLEEQKEESEKMKQKLEKYKQVKDENKVFVSKIAELMEKLDEQKNENIKLVNSKNDIKNEYISTINKLQKDLNESEFKIKNMEIQIKKLESEKEKNMENSTAEALRLKTLEITNNMSMQSGEKLKEIEERLKMLTDKESTDLKEQLKEKEFNYMKINEKYKKLENEYDELNKTMEKIPEELKRREEAIEYYKNQLDKKEKECNESIRILSSLYYRLSFQCANLRQDRENKNLNSLNIYNNLNSYFFASGKLI